MSGADSNPVKASRLHGLDTLRAVAILAVMIFHLQGYLPHALDPISDVGWAGVDLFFVLSGFLIGSQLLHPFVRGERLRGGDFPVRESGADCLFHATRRWGGWERGAEGGKYRVSCGGEWAV